MAIKKIALDNVLIQSKAKFDESTMPVEQIVFVTSEGKSLDVTNIPSIITNKNYGFSPSTNGNEVGTLKEIIPTVVIDNVTSTSGINALSANQGRLLNGKIDTEITNRTNADNVLQTNINNEATTRLNNDNTLQSYIDLRATITSLNTEIQARIDGDTNTLANSKTYTDTKIGALGDIFVLKGSVQSIANLPTTGNKEGDVWFVINESVGYLWILVGSTYRWEKFGAEVDLTAYLTKTEANTTYVALTVYNTFVTNTNTALANKEPSFSKNTAFNKIFETNIDNIKMDGVGAVGTSINVPRADHIHPSDTTKATVQNLSTETTNRINADITLQNNINLKANIDSPTFTGNVIVPNANANNEAVNLGQIPTSLPASDVYTWAKQPNKPTYNANEVGALPTSTRYAGSNAVGGGANFAYLFKGTDTRSTNENPSWYMQKGSSTILTEFKFVNIIGLSPIITTTFCQLTTFVSWGDYSGGYPVQVATSSGIGGKIAIRSGASNTEWSSWSAINDYTDLVTLSTVQTISGNKTFSGTVTLPSTTSIGNVTNTEIEYLDGVTSNIQTQINSTNTTVANVSNVANSVNNRYPDNIPKNSVGSCNSIGVSGTFYVQENDPYRPTDVGIGASNDYMIHSMMFSPVWGSQVARDFRSDREWVRNKNNNTWSEWALIAKQNAVDLKLDKLSCQYNKEISFGGSGVLYIGSFPVYDTNITIDISSTTSTTYNARLIIACQNYIIQSAVTYGDGSNTVTPNIYIKPSNPNDRFVEVYFAPSGWSKNIIEIKGSAVRGVPTNICENIPNIPTTATIKPSNSLDIKLNKNLGSAESGKMLTVNSSGNIVATPLATTTINWNS